MGTRTLPNVSVIAASVLHNPALGNDPKNANVYASFVEPLDVLVADRHYWNGCTDHSAASAIMGVTANGYYLPGDGAIKEWAPFAISQVSYKHNGCGLFATFGNASGKSDTVRETRKPFTALGVNHIGYLPLVRINVMSVKHGKANVDRTITLIADSEAFITHNAQRLTTPDLSNVRGIMIVEKNGRGGTPYTSRETFYNNALDTLIAAYGIPALWQIIADQLQSVLPFVVDKHGSSVNVVPAVKATVQAMTATPNAITVGTVIPFSDAATVPNGATVEMTATGLRITSLPVVSPAFSVGQIVPFNDAASIPEGATVEMTANGIKIVALATVPTLPPAFNPSALFAHKPSNTATVPSADNDAPKVLNAATADTPNKTARQKTGKLTANEQKAVDLAKSAGKKSRDDNRHIANYLPDSYSGTYKGKAETAQQRRERAALQTL